MMPFQKGLSPSLLSLCKYRISLQRPERVSDLSQTPEKHSASKISFKPLQEVSGRPQHGESSKFVYTGFFSCFSYGLFRNPHTWKDFRTVSRKETNLTKPVGMLLKITIVCLEIMQNNYILHVYQEASKNTITELYKTIRQLS